MNKLSLGYAFDVRLGNHVKAGIGGLANAYSIPARLEPVYGAGPASYTVFLRLKLD